MSETAADAAESPLSASRMASPACCISASVLMALAASVCKTHNDLALTSQAAKERTNHLIGIPCQKVAACLVLELFVICSFSVQIFLRLCPAGLSTDGTLQVQNLKAATFGSTGAT